MPEVRAKFRFESVAMDTKTTVVQVKTIQLVGETEIFQFPRERQTKTQHERLFNHSVVQRVTKSLKTRNKFRNVIITLSDELKKIYLDEEGNVVFDGYYLEEVGVDPPSSGVPTLQAQEKSIHSIAKNMVIEKFNGGNRNAKTWLHLFIQECSRLDVREERCAEVLRLFLEDPAMDWYLNFLKTNSLDQPWEYWNNSFMDTFAEISWSEIAYVYTFKYLSGPLLNFTLKKRSLLIDADPDLAVNSQINLIVTALPPFIRSKLIKKDVKTVEDLMSRLRQLEPVTNKQNKGEDKIRAQINNKPCSNCEKLGFKSRFHPEKLCRMKDREFKSDRNDKIRIANNSEILSACEETKN